MPKQSSLVLEDVKKVSIHQFDLPTIAAEEALLNIELVGVCGSDGAFYSGKVGPKPFPLILGHEMVGFIEEAGHAFRQRHEVNQGDRVIVEHTFGCGHCPSCLTGNYRLCKRNLRYGSTISCADPPHLWGAYGQYLYLPFNAMVHKITNSMSAGRAVLISAVIGNAVRWMTRVGQIRLGDTVLICGVGPQGLASVAVAREAGAGQVIVTGLGRDRERFEVAREMGADSCLNVETTDLLEELGHLTQGRMADLAIDNTGSPSAVRVLPRALRVGGTLVLPGMYGSGKKVPMELDDIVRREITVHGVFTHDMESVVPAMRLADSDRYPWDRMLTHRYSLKDGEEPLKILAGDQEAKGFIKAVIDPWA